jgi:hypothetical protein
MSKSLAELQRSTARPRDTLCLPRRELVRRSQMLGDYLICTETCGNDAGTALILNITHLGKERSRLEYGLPDTTRTSTSTVSPATILLTGFPGCGKTTLIKRVVQRLDDLRLAGFYTQELLGANGRRVGFEAIGLNGRSTTLAHVSSKSKDRVGSRRYRGRIRLPEWDRRIREAEEEFDRAAEAWRHLQEGL